MGLFAPGPSCGSGHGFLDGSFPVFYSALAMETAQAEVAYWFGKVYAGRPQGARTAYYQSFRCTFEGLEKDLRPKTRDWPDLVHDSDYSFCNRLGAEAREQGVDGLIVPSARHEGANMPIFARKAVSDPELEGIVRITYSPDADETSIDRPSQGVTAWSPLSAAFPHCPAVRARTTRSRRAFMHGRAIHAGPARRRPV